MKHIPLYESFDSFIDDIYQEFKDRFDRRIHEFLEAGYGVGKNEQFYLIYDGRFNLTKDQWQEAIDIVTKHLTKKHKRAKVGEQNTHHYAYWTW